jgi:hypothetical protein
LGPAERAAAHEPRQGDIYATVGPYAYRTKTGREVVKDETDFGLGIVAEGDVDYNGGVEIAMIYLDKIYVRAPEEGDATRIDPYAERIRRMYITTGYRHWFTPWVSFAGAFFSSYSMGDPRHVELMPEGSAEDPTSARAITEYGMDFSVQVEIVRGKTYAIVADSRYSWSLSRKRREDADVMGVLVGFKYLVPKQGESK